MNAYPTFGCGVATLVGFYHDPWGRNTIRDQLDQLIANPPGPYIRKYLAVVTDDQMEAKRTLDNHPKARLLSKAMNYRVMNYIYEIDTKYFIGPSPDLPRIPFRQTIRRKNRKGTLSTRRKKNK